MPRQVAEWMAKLAATLAESGVLNACGGHFYVTEVRFGFDGDDIDYSLVANDFEDFDVRIGARP